MYGCSTINTIDITVTAKWINVLYLKLKKVKDQGHVKVSKETICHKESYRTDSSSRGRGAVLLGPLHFGVGEWCCYVLHIWCYATQEKMFCTINTCTNYESHAFYIAEVMNDIDPFSNVCQRSWSRSYDLQCRIQFKGFCRQADGQARKTTNKVSP